MHRRLQDRHLAGPEVTVGERLVGLGKILGNVGDNLVGLAFTVVGNLADCRTGIGIALGITVGDLGLCCRVIDVGPIFELVGLGILDRRSRLIGGDCARVVRIARLGITGRFPIRGARGLSRSDRAVGALGAVIGRRRIGGRVGGGCWWFHRVGTQPVLEGFHHVGTRHELRQWRQIGRAVQADPLQEQIGGPEEHRVARPGIARDLVHIATLLQGSEHTVDVDASDGGDLHPADRLLVRHDGEGFERSGRQPRGLPVEHEPLDIRSEIRVALEPVTAGHSGQDEPSTCGLVLCGELIAQGLDIGLGDLEELGQHTRVDRAVGHHQNRLDGLSGLGGAHPRPSENRGAKGMVSPRRNRWPRARGPHRRRPSRR